MIDFTTYLYLTPVPQPQSPNQKFGVTPAFKRRNHRLYWLAALSLLATVLTGACSNRTGLDDSVENLTVKTLSGRQFSLRELTGPVLVSFWSTSCAICLAEMPDMVELYEDFSGKGFELVAIAMPYDPPNEVLELAESRQLPFPVALDLKGEAVAAFGSVKGTPTSYLIDANGKLVQRYVGAIDFDGLHRQLDKLVETS